PTAAGTAGPPMSAFPVRQVDGNHWLTGGLVGAAIGAVFGVALVHFGHENCDCSNSRDDTTVIVAPIVILGLLGAFIGAFIPKRD
ncbi:MAG TPA: hypothetical protein VGL65_10055, partial [Gemmatimonadales bacterium]